MEIATAACLQREKFQSQIHARIIDALLQSIARVKDALSRFEYETPIHMASKRIIVMDERSPFSASSREREARWVPAVKACKFTLAETVNNSMDPSLSIQKRIMQYNGKILVADKTDGLLCFEYMPKGSLGKYLSDEYHEFDWQTRFNIVKGICTILAYLHGQLKPRIYHLDLKPANMLLDWNMVAKITDFGLTMCLREERTRLNISMATNGIVKYNGRIVLADMIDRLLCYECMQNGNLDEYHGLDWPTCFNIVKGICTGLAHLHEGFCHIDLKPANVLLDDNMVPKIADEKHGSGILPRCFGEEARKIKSLMLLAVLLVDVVWSTRSEMSPDEFAEIVYQNWRNRWKFESSSKQIKRLNQIVLSCLETGKSTKAMNSTVSSTQRAVHDILILDSGAAISATVDASEMKPLPAYITALNMASVDLVLDSDGSALAAALSIHQHLYRSNLTDERSDKPCSNRAPATNSSDETTRAPMANKLTDDEAENHSDPNSSVVERDAIEEAKRSGEWCVATGAAHHTTWNRDLITNMEELENDGLYVHAADGTPMPVCGRGNVVTDDVVLPDVYYVPGLCTNLVSVGQLAGLDYCVGFGRGACVISSAAGTVVGRAHARGDGLYEVDFLRVPLGMP